MIRLRGVPISIEDAAELARGLLVQSEASLGIAERLERAIVAGTGVIATTEPEARAVLAALEERANEALRDVRESLRHYVDR